MTRGQFGATSSDFAADRFGNRLVGAVGTVWREQSMTTRVYDLLTRDGNATDVVVSATTSFSGTVYPASSSVMRTRAQSVSAGIVTNPGTASTVPFTWATGDIVRFQLTYEAA